MNRIQRGFYVTVHFRYKLSDDEWINAVYYKECKR